MTSASLLGRRFEELCVGDAFETGRRTVSESDVNTFAHLTGDTHPMHVDPIWAERNRFGERIAHGLLVLACALGLLDFPADHAVALRRVSRLTFKRPCLLGESIHAHIRIAKLTPYLDTVGVVEMDLVVHDTNEATLMRGRIAGIWPTLAADASGTVGGSTTADPPDNRR